MKVLFVSLGCDKNLADAEEMLGMLREAGYSFTDDEQEAEIIIVNTCCFIGDAKEESIQTILELAVQKETGKCKVLLVTGCLAERYKEEVLTEMPEVDAIIGTRSYDHLITALEKALSGKRSMELCGLERLPERAKKRVLTTGGYYSYLKIAEGCNKHCTYCVIPSIRGNFTSVPMEDLVAQAEQLAENGVTELILVAQETTLYGVDIYGKKMLPELLKKLCCIERLKWIRILYCYPEEITDELIEVIATEKKICHYLDIPIQSGSDSVLKRMGRRTNCAQLSDTISKLREQVPDIALRTTLISGFPGETAEDHENTLDFVDAMEFERLGVFTYSPEEGTPAAKMPDQIDEDIKEARRDEIMELQQEIAFEKAEAMTGRRLTVLIEGKLPEDNVYVGRTYMDAPGVDGNIFVTCEEELYTGEYVEVTVTGGAEYDLLGECIKEPILEEKL
ncbi:MAG: 30S ribosomal protein S12 methylthiotransferase RimO [Lachnospiraceae bacterium]|nr:30S ribosomal protein S12 methylthiotransferase RimO [Lachnospiraceae bacterium]